MTAARAGATVTTSMTAAGARLPDIRTAMRQSQINNAFRGARLSYATREDEMSAYDSLPADLRRTIDENATKLSAVNCVVQAWKLLDMGASPARAAQAVANKIRQIEPNEIAVFAGEYLTTYKYRLPHVAA